MNKIKKCIIALVSAAALVGLDQWTKWLAVRDLKGQAPYKIIDGVLELTYHENRGAAFGILQNSRIFFLILTVVILVVISYIFFKLPEKKHWLPVHILLVFISAGAIGNMIDRFFNGFVVDFVYIPLINFPVFNLADIFISWSAVLLILFTIFKYKNTDLKEVFKDD